MEEIPMCAKGLFGERFLLKAAAGARKKSGPIKT
jgi:hypothetical protein